MDSITGIRVVLANPRDKSSLMIMTSKPILDGAIDNLKPLHQELIRYIMNLPGRRKPSGVYARRTWGLSRDEFLIELGYALDEIRRYLNRHGLNHSGDLLVD